MSYKSIENSKNGDKSATETVMMDNPYNFIEYYCSLNEMNDGCRLSVNHKFIIVNIYSLNVQFIQRKFKINKFTSILKIRNNQNFMDF